MTDTTNQTTPRMDDYRSSIDNLQFSDEAKERMTARLATEAASAQATSATTARRPRRQRLPIAAAAAGIALALTAGSIAYASGSLVSLTQFVNHLFGQEAQVEVVDKVGHPVGVATSSDGVTVTADAIIGDRRNVAVIFSVAKDDGSAFEGIETVGDNLLSMGFEENDASIGMPLFTGSNGSSYFYDEDPSDNAIQMVVTRSYLGEDADTSLIGRDMSVHLEKLVSYSGDDYSTTVLADGSWDLSFPLNYEDASVALESGQDFDLNGMNATIDSLTISPVGLHMTYTAHTDRTLEAQESGQESEANAALSNDLLTPKYVITLTDGTTIDVDSASGGGMINEVEGGQSCEQGAFFDRVINLDEVASVSVGDTVIEL